MSCVAIEHLAAAASDETSGEAALAIAHAQSCERCAALLAEQRELRALVRRAAPPALAGSRRSDLAARLQAVAGNAGNAGPCPSFEDLASAASVDDGSVAAAGIASASPFDDGSDAVTRIASHVDEPDEQLNATLEHASACEQCATLIAEQRELRQLARRLPWPSLDDDRRAELAAEVMARSETLPRKRRTRIVLAGVAIAAAASIAIGIGMRAGERPQVAGSAGSGDSVGSNLDSVGSSAGRDLRAPRVAPVVEPIEVPDVAPVPQLAVVTPGSGAQLSRETTANGDVVRLRDGGVTIDAERSSTVVVTGDTRVDVSRARASITAQRGVVQAVQVFAGSVEVTSGGKRKTVSAGTVWRAELGDTTARPTTPPTTPPIATTTPTTTPPTAPPTTTPPTVTPTAPNTPVPTIAEASMRAFRDGWSLLRAGKHRDAIAAFDRATDPVVAEDAVFWAAVAAERAGDRDDALRRYTSFIARFASSPRIDSARAATRRLAP